MTVAKALIMYATRTNQTKKLAELIAEGIRMKGFEVKVLNVNEYDNQKIDPQSFDAIVLGAATYHGDMMQSMKTFLFTLEKANLEGKVGGAFGAFGWSGEAPVRIYDTMKHIFKMEMVHEPLRLKTAALGGGIQMAQEYGKQIATKMAG
jgi:flavorubredoxin